MILCWGVLWNISDETPQNCQKFVEIGGLKIMMVSSKLKLISVI